MCWFLGLKIIYLWCKSDENHNDLKNYQQKWYKVVNGGKF